MKPTYCYSHSHSHCHHRYRHFIVPLLLLSFSLPPSASLQLHRRLLHQPLFPATSPPPPPSDDQVIPPPDQPFFPEVPAGYQNQPQQPPPSSSQLANNGSGPIPTATQPAKPAKKVAIAISVGIVTLGMLTGFAFFLYRHRVKHPIETPKRYRSRRLNDAPPVMPPSSVLYMGTVQPARMSGEVNAPPTTAAINESAGAGDVSPYRKLSSVKRCDRYRPSPDLQPLPALLRPPSQSEIVEKSNDGDDGDSSSSISSSDEESQGTAFYTPQGSLIGNDDGYYTPAIAPISKTVNGNVNSVPCSKRTSPKSRQNERVENVDAVTSYFLKRPKFSAPPPPPPNMAILRSIRKTPPPPPPPPVPTTVSSSKQELRTATPEAVFKREESISGGGDGEEGSKPKLKALHWDKVRATSDRVTVWDQLKSSSFQLNEDMMESLFGCNPTNTSVQKEPTSRRSVLPVSDRENRVLDPKKSQNIAILLRALNVTRDEVSEALLDGNPESLGAELLETLVKMAPTKEEEIKLRNYSGDTSKLGSAERFLKTVLDIPFAFTRVEAMLYRANFDTEVKYLRKSFQTLEEASEELKSSRLFLKLLEAVLRTGNRMNVGTNRGDAKAFKLDTLLKLVDIKGTDGKTTLLHFVVQEIIRSEGGNTDFGNENAQDSGNLKCRELQVVSGLSRDLSNVKKAAGMDSDVLSSYVSKLEKGLEKVRSVLQCEKPDMQGKFFDSMKLFLREAEEEIDRIKADERRALSLVKEATEYFHGDAAKEEAHPFRIFMIVRDFLNILDHVCKEVGKMQDKTVMGSARSFRISASASLPVLNRYNAKHDITSDEESSSP